jgi:hypothetical protein
MSHRLLAVALCLLPMAPLAAGPSAHASKAERVESVDPADEEPLTEEERASRARSEYVRLREELDKLAKRNAWSGVERTFREMLATGVAPSFDDLKTGAHAAQALGDLGTAHDRLERAHSIKESKDVLDWMWNIRKTYGAVELAGDVGRVELEAATMPFDPIQAKAVRFAIEQIGETGRFDGLLPKGTYTFGEVEFEVASFIDTRMIDVRTEAGMRRARRARDKARKKD